MSEHKKRASIVVAASALAFALAGPARAAPDVSLRGLVLVDSRADLRREGWPAEAVSGVDSSHLSEISEADANRVLARYLGQLIDMKLLEGIRQSLQSYFEANHQPFVSVAVPPQGIDSGVVQVLVIVSKLGKLQVTGNEWFGADQYENALHLKPGQPIDGHVLDADIDTINGNQYRHAEAVASPGRAVGTTDIMVKTKEELPFTFNGGVDNTGTRATSLYRWNAGFDWGNAFWRGDDINYRFTASTDVDLLQEHQLTYSTTLPWGHTLSISGNYSTSNTPTSSVIGNSGITGGASLHYTIPLLSPNWLTHRVTLGYDFKSTNNNILFGGFSVFGTTSEVDQFSADYNAQIPDAHGTTNVDVNLVFSPGGLTTLNTDAIFNTQVPGAKAEYFYAHLSADHQTKLGGDWVWDLRGTLQMSADALLPSEQIVLGGYASVRGYQDQAATRDNGLLIENEIRAPSIEIGLPGHLGLDKGEDLIPFVFLDYGAGWNHLNGTAVGSWISIASAGPGMTYQVGKIADIRFTWGIPLGHHGESVPHLGPQFAVQFSL